MDSTGVGTGFGHHLCPRSCSPGPVLGLGLSSPGNAGAHKPLEERHCTGMGWEKISCFLMTPGSASPPVPPGRLSPSPSALHSAAEQRRGRRRRQAGEGTLDRLQSSGTDRDRHRLLQGHGLTARQRRWPRRARSPRQTCRCLLVPGCTGHLQLCSVFWEGVRMQTGDAQAQELRQPHTSRSRLGSVPVSAAGAARGHGPGVCRVPLWWLQRPAVSSGVGTSPMLRLPEPGSRRCWRCATTGPGPKVAAANTDSPEICWHGRWATAAGPTPVLLEPSPTPWPCADGYQG